MCNYYFCPSEYQKSFFLSLQRNVLCTVIQVYVQVYSVISVRDELVKCEYICSVLCTLQLNVLCTDEQCYVST